MAFTPRYRELDDGDLLDAAANRETSRSEFLGANVVQSFLDSPIIGRIIDNNGIAIQEGRKAKALPSFFYDDPEPTELTPEQQKASPDFRQNLGVVPGTTEGAMRFRAEQADQQAWRDFLIARRDAGVVDIALGFGAQIVGGGVDPINYIPIVGPAMRAAYLARAGGRAAYLLRGAAVGALEGAAGNLLAAPLTATLFSNRGREYGLEDLAADIVFGAAAGGAFGGVGGLLEGRGSNVPSAAREVEALAPPPRALTDQRAVIESQPVPEPNPGQRLSREIFRKTAPPIPRMADVARAAQSLELATQQVVTGDTVDIAKMAPARAPLPKAPKPAEQVFTARGDPVEVSYRVVEADQLTTSNADDLQVNPNFPADLQPRDRSRAASADQIQNIAANLRPELLDRSALASDGAPIIGPDGVVESGNARTMAIRRAYQRNMPSAESYRAYLDQQGYNVEGMRAPVLVRERNTPMTPDERAAFTRDANERSTASMSPTERALTDARLIDDRALASISSTDLYAAGNRPFIRSFVDRLPVSERAGLVTASGELSKAGAERVKMALLARAYDDADLVARLVEEPESGLGTMGGALMEAAPEWARMRAEIAAGTVAREGDGTEALLDAARAILNAKEKGNPVGFVLQQEDMFGGGLTSDAKAFASAMITANAKGDTRLIGRERLTERLRGYIGAAGRQQPGTNMFGEPPSYPDELLVALGYADPAAVPKRPLSDRSPAAPLPDPDAALRAELKQDPPDPLKDEFPEIAVFELRKEQGRVNAEDLAAFDTATAEAQRLNDIEKAYDVASACVIRGLGL